MEGIWTNYPVFEATLLLGWEGGHTNGCSKGGSVSKCNASQASLAQGDTVVLRCH